MAIARLYARRSTCKYFKIGVVFVRNNRILTAGYNGPPRGEPHCEEVGCQKEDGSGKRLPAGSGLCRGAHAETNAIANASTEGVNLSGAKVYCSFSPCFDCAKILVNLGVIEFIYADDYPEKENPMAIDLFQRQGVIVRKFKPLEGGQNV
jgi:dCMP deaminase